MFPGAAEKVNALPFIAVIESRNVSKCVNNFNLRNLMFITKFDDCPLLSAHFSVGSNDTSCTACFPKTQNGAMKVMVDVDRKPISLSLACDQNVGKRPQRFYTNESLQHTGDREVANHHLTTPKFHILPAKSKEIKTSPRTF